MRIISIKFLLPLFFVFFFLDSSAQTASKTIKIGYLVPKKSEGSKKEQKASLKYLNNSSQLTVEVINFQKISKRPDILERFDVLWFHKQDNTEFTVLEQSIEVRTGIYNYLQKGGSLLLTLDAFKYINVLDIERKIPEIRVKKNSEHGDSLRLGFSGFGNHPVFTGLNAQANILNPKEELTVNVIGYFDNNIPNNAKVIAVDNENNTILKNSKIVLEYQVGKGKVIAIGAYLLFSEKSVNMIQLKPFTNNCFLYLSGKLKSQNEYWRYR